MISDKARLPGVSILVFLDDPLRDGLGQHPHGKIGVVSILVFLDDPLRGGRCP